MFLYVGVVFCRPCLFACSRLAWKWIVERENRMEGKKGRKGKKESEERLEDEKFFLK